MFEKHRVLTAEELRTIVGLKTVELSGFTEDGVPCKIVLHPPANVTHGLVRQYVKDAITEAEACGTEEDSGSRSA